MVYKPFFSGIYLISQTLWLIWSLPQEPFLSGLGISRGSWVVGTKFSIKFSFEKSLDLSNFGKAAHEHFGKF